MRRARRPLGWRQTRPDPAKVGPLLRQAGFRASEDDPIYVRASFDGGENPRRIHARYANGWTCLMHLSIDGSFSLSQSFRVQFSGRLPA